MSDEYRAFIQSASPQELFQQLNLEVKQPLVSAQNVINILMMTLNPSPSMQRKLESGEIDPAAMLTELTEDITRVLDVIDFYRESLGISEGG
jgi:hypothetical protein